MHTGYGTSILPPVYSKVPLFLLIAKVNISPESWLAAWIKLPKGSIEKFLGVFPRVDSWPTFSNFLPLSKTLNIAKLSCPLFDP